MSALPNKTPTMRVLATPRETNSGGDIFGGWIMSQVDLAGNVLARREAKGRVVTVAVNSFHFKKPVYVGDLVSLYASVDTIGTTSITINIEVFSERNTPEPEVVKVTEANVTYVAIDDKRRPRLIK